MTPNTHKPSGAIRSWAAGALIVLLTVLAYLPALRAGFIWDDTAYVTENPLLTAPDGLKLIWFSAHQQSQYFPLVFTTFRLEHALWGLNPLGYHLVNVLVHGANALLVWVVLRRLGMAGAWLAAAIFALHPVQVESVAWVTELKNTQSTMFYLLAVWTWLKFAGEATRHRWRFYALALLFQALALFSKTTACTLPAALLLVLWMRGERIGLRRLVQVSPFLAMGLAMGLVSIWWEWHLGNYGEEVGQSFSWLERLMIASRALWFYAEKLVWPVNLTFISYPKWEIGIKDPLQYGWFVACLLTAFALWRWRNVLGRGAVAGIAFFVAALLPLLGFIPLYTIQYSFVADHYQYAACIGLIALFAAVISRQAAALRLGLYMRCALSSILLLLLGALTWQQCHIYRNLETLWRDTLVKNPNSWLAHNNLGLVLADENNLVAAEEHYRKALELRPGYPTALNNLGTIMLAQGRLAAAAIYFGELVQKSPNLAPAWSNLGAALFRQGNTNAAMPLLRRAVTMDPKSSGSLINLTSVLMLCNEYSEAVDYLRQLLALKPDHVQARRNLGSALLALGRTNDAIVQFEEGLRHTPDEGRFGAELAKISVAQGQTSEAMDKYFQAIKSAPSDPMLRYNLGVLLSSAGRVAEAVEQYRAAIQLKPDYAEAHNNLGIALKRTGQFDEAAAHYLEALRLKPVFPEAHNNFGIMLMQVQHWAEAEQQFRESLKLNAEQPKTLFNLGNVLAIQGRFEEAVKQFEQSLRLSPENAEAEKNLGQALARLGKTEEAIQHLRAALRLRPDYAEAKEQLRKLGAPVSD